jgi:hypothetical protein
MSESDPRAVALVELSLDVERCLKAALELYDLSRFCLATDSSDTVENQLYLARTFGALGKALEEMQKRSPGGVTFENGPEGQRIFLDEPELSILEVFGLSRTTAAVLGDNAFASAHEAAWFFADELYWAVYSTLVPRGADIMTVPIPQLISGFRSRQQWGSLRASLLSVSHSELALRVIEVELGQERNAAVRDVATGVIETSPAAKCVAVAEPGSAPLGPPLQSATDLARRLGQPPDAVESFLRRYRQKYPDCCSETEGRRRNEARYLYRVSDVLPALKAHFSETTDD